MIIWLASYPKSGNTLLRSMISAYFFTKDGNFSFKNLNNISQFPDFKLFENFGIKTSDQMEIVKNYINVQRQINIKDKNSIRFIKTHSALRSINGYEFTDFNNSFLDIFLTTPFILICLSILFQKKHKAMFLFNVGDKQALVTIPTCALPIWTQSP